jgi:hypothetical protein
LKNLNIQPFEEKETNSIMSSSTRSCVIWFFALNMSLCLITNAGLILRPSLHDEEVLAILESNGLFNNDYENSNREERRQAPVYLPLSPSLYDDFNIRQLVNHHTDYKRSRLNLHTNLNLPRYLRTVY